MSVYPLEADDFGPDSAYIIEEDAYSEDVIQGAIAAETAAQAKVCSVPTDPNDYDDDLLEALKRRVVCNLARRGLPIAIVQADAAVSYVPTNDPEVKRLEKPYRRRYFGSSGTTTA